MIRVLLCFLLLSAGLGAAQTIYIGKHELSRPVRPWEFLDAVGKPTVEPGLRCLAPFGHLILYGRAGGVPDPVNLMSLFQKSTKVSGFVLYTVSAMPDKHREGIEKSFQLMREGKLKLLIGKSFPLAEAAAAHRLMESRGSVGKLVLIP